MQILVLKCGLNSPDSWKSTELDANLDNLNGITGVGGGGGYYNMGKVTKEGMCGI